MCFVFFNCFLRYPGWMFRDMQKIRIKMIPQYTIIDKKTICGLCEVFGNSYGDKLNKEYQKHGFVFIGAKNTSSGLGIAYDPQVYKIISNKFEPYFDAKLPDNLVTKGIMHCVIECIDCGQRNTIIVTHLQSAYEEDLPSLRKLAKFRKVQKNQLLQLAHYIQKNKIDRYILMGDFNINKDLNNNLFRLFVKLFNYEDSINLLPSTATFPEENTIIDYILINNGSKHKKTIVLNTRAHKIIANCHAFDQMRNYTHKQRFISDHYAVAAI